MASLKEIRARINSVTTTLKITDVTHMIAAAKLHKFQNVSAQYSRYCKKIDEIFTNYLSGVEMPDFPLTQMREVKKVAIVAISSNTSKCGAFNANVIKATDALLQEYSNLGEDGILLYTVGNKVCDAFKNVRKLNGPYYEEIQTPSFSGILPLAEELINKFINKEVDKVIIVNNRFRNLLTQVIVHKTLLPFTSDDDDPIKIKENKNKKVVVEEVEESHTNIDYIVEPGPEELIKTLAPQLVKLNLYGKFLESSTSEHAARSAAMQSATDNARDLIKELTKEYNRQRQAAITNEILDIVGGAEALK